MKTIFKSIVISFLVLITISFVFTRCKENTECKSVITVKLLQDTTKVVAGANIRIHKLNVDVRGVSDANGKFRHTFPLEAILDVYAMRKDTLGDSLYGNAVLKLVPGGTAYKTVFVK